MFICLFCYFIIPLFYRTLFNCFWRVFVCYHLVSFLTLGYFATFFGQFYYILLVFYLTLL